MNTYRLLALASCTLAFVVVVVGAYVRLSDAGLGCPDWPGCYGHVGVPESHEEIAQANRAYPGIPVEKPKARKEMFHRYLAGTLGIMILALAIVAVRYRRNSFVQASLASSLVVLVGFQATLGMWTVTLLLKPAIVTAHLLGGMATLALLVLLACPFVRLPRWPAEASALRHGAKLALVALVAQIALGGWVSTNYAALACPDLPACRGELIPPMDFTNGFHVIRELGRTSDGALLSTEALTAIHLSHRLGAVVVATIILGFAVALTRRPACRSMGYLLGVLTLAQFAIGLANVQFRLPLGVAVAHNAGAATLLVCLVVINFAASRNDQASSNTDG